MPDSAETIMNLHGHLTEKINSPARGAEAKAAHDALFAPDFVYVSYPPNFIVPTKDVPDLKIENLHEAVKDRTVFAEAALSGTYQGSDGWLGIAKAGTPFAVRVCTVTTFNEAGLVSRRAIYLDKETLEKQLSGDAFPRLDAPKVTFNLNEDERALLAEFGIEGGHGEYGYH